MIDAEVATLLDDYARAVERLPGVCRRNPHVFTERKSDLAGAMRKIAKDLRTVRAAPAVIAGAITPGLRQIGRRTVLVERRRA